MARTRASEIKVNITGDADLSAARREIDGEWKKIERGAKDTAKKIEAAFDDIEIAPEIDQGALRDAESRFDRFVSDLEARGVDLEVDTDQLRRAFDLAEDLDRLTVDLDIETDTIELEAAEALARNLRSFTGRIDLDVQGTADLREALGISEALERTRSVKVELAGLADLDRAEAAVRGLDGSDIDVRVDVNDGDLAGLDDQFADAGQTAGDAFANGFDPEQLGTSLSGGMLGVVGNLGPWGIAAAGAGALFAEDFSAGFEASWGGEREAVIRSVRSGLSDAAMEEVGEAAAEAYAVGFGESIVLVRDTAALIEAELSGIDAELDLTEATKQAEALAEVFGVEVADSVRLAQRLVANDLVDSTDEAFNLMTKGAQDFGVQTEDALAGFDEFAPVLRKLGIDGATAFDIVGRQIDEGLVPSVDRAFEQFEEFNIVMSDGSAREAVESLGLSFDELQAKVADGRGAEAMAEIATALSGVGNEAERNQKFVEIFGGSVESAGSEARVLGLLATADAIGEVGNEADNMVGRLEESRTNIDEIKKTVEALGSAVADAVNGMNFEDGTGGLASGGSAGLNSFIERMGGAEDATLRWSDRLSELSGGVLGRDFNPKLLTTSKGLEKVGESGEDAADGIDTTTDAVAELDAALDDFAGRFDADATFRNIVEDSEAAAEAVAGLTSASFDAATGFDITTEAGREAEAAMEDLSGNLDDLYKLYQDGKISGEEFADGQAQIRASLARVIEELELGEDAARALYDLYGIYPDELTTDIGINDNATGPVNGITETIGNVPNSKTIDIIVNNRTALGAISGVALGLANLKDKTVTVRTVTRGVVNPDQRADGGPVKPGRLTLVGEEGPELVQFSGAGYVYTADETRALLNGARSNTPAPAMVGAGVGRGGVNIENWYVERGREPFQDIALLEQMFSL